MSSDWHPRRAALLLLLALAACGLQPVYAPGGGALALRGTVDVSAPPTVAGYLLRDHLIRRLGTGETPRFALDVTQSTSRGPATITSDGDITRFNLAGQASWTMTDRTSGNVTSGTVRSFSSYSATGSTVATQAAEDDAEARLSVALADLIVAQLTLDQATP